MYSDSVVSGLYVVLYSPGCIHNTGIGVSYFLYKPDNNYKMTKMADFFIIGSFWLHIYSLM